jgi:pyruvate kinase
MRKTKIIATLGPATASYGKIAALIKAGVNVFRLNFSHGDDAFFSRAIAGIRRAGNKLNISVAIMQDLQGPKIRVAGLEAAINVKRGDKVELKSQKSKRKSGTKSISLDFKYLYKYVKPGQRILINDGMVQLRVKGVKGSDIICNVTAGGEIAPRKGVNLPGTKLPVPSMTAKDRKNLKFGLKNKVDIVCLSFVREAKDIKVLNGLIKGKKNRPLVIAKIEKPEALKQINAILDVSDGVMVARGDLAVEAGYRIIPEAQKDIIKKANAKGKLVIVATQMLESMIQNPYPERAEITDVYNAVLDGADILMLSGETSVGKYPEKTVRVMSDIIKEAEKNRDRARGTAEFIKGGNAYENVFSYAAAKAAEELENAVIAARVLCTDDIQYISDYRPSHPIIALAQDEDMFKKLAVYNGVYPMLIKGNAEKAVDEVKKRFPAVKNIIYVNMHGNKRSKGELLVYKVR